MVVRVQLPLSLQMSKWWTRVYQSEYTILQTKLSKICELKMWQYLWILIRLTLVPSGMILCKFQHIHLVMMLLMLTSNEQETRVLLVLVFLMMTKHARQVGVQPPLPPGSGALGEAQQRSQLQLQLIKLMLQTMQHMIIYQLRNLLKHLMYLWQKIKEQLKLN